MLGLLSIFALSLCAGAGTGVPANHWTPGRIGGIVVASLTATIIVISASVVFCPRKRAKPNSECSIENTEGSSTIPMSK